ncbi:MAG: NAD-dependent protein deacylase [Clostridia bacterium]|nr:NAD-dependent protein deacylase [Clostridia bacterium]
MYEEFSKIINRSKRIVFFGGAGVSTESGIPDFRSVDGLYNQKYDVPPEVILSHTYFINHTDKFYKFYREKMLFEDDIKPNAAHLKLAELEKQGKLTAVVTQNIDGLHQKAGSKNVYELHGSIHRNYCMKCKKFYPLDYILKEKSVPLCECGGIIKPDVVLYEENLNEEIIEKSVAAIENADTMIVAGTSLTVYPAAGMIRYFRGDHLILINLVETQWDSNADMVIHDKVGNVMNCI